VDLLSAIAQLIVCYLKHRRSWERLWWDDLDRRRCPQCGIYWRK
jgi:hypothetical protein